MTTPDTPNLQSQRALAQLLSGCLTEAGKPHDVVLGTLLSLYAELAVQHSCCLAESVRASRVVLAKVTEAALAAQVGIDTTDRAAVQRDLCDHILHWMGAGRVTVGDGLNALLSLYRHIVLQNPAALGDAAMALSALAGEMLSRAAVSAGAAPTTSPASGGQTTPLH